MSGAVSPAYDGSLKPKENGVQASLDLRSMTLGQEGRRWLWGLAIAIVVVYAVLFLLFLNRIGSISFASILEYQIIRSGKAMVSRDVFGIVFSGRAPSALYVTEYDPDVRVGAAAGSKACNPAVLHCWMGWRIPVCRPVDEASGTTRLGRLAVHRQWFLHLPIRLRAYRLHPISFIACVPVATSLQFEMRRPVRCHSKRPTLDCHHLVNGCGSCIGN